MVIVCFFMAALLTIEYSGNQQEQETEQPGLADSTAKKIEAIRQELDELRGHQSTSQQKLQSQPQSQVVPPKKHTPINPPKPVKPIAQVGDIQVSWKALNPKKRQPKNPEKRQPKLLHRVDVHSNNWQETQVSIALSEAQLRLLRGEKLIVEVCEGTALSPVASQTIPIGNDLEITVSLIDHSEKMSVDYYLLVSLGNQVLYKELIVENRKFTR